ncbi:MAG: 50S ribosomal protein L11 methyltransferase [Thermoanaerobaculia bacterium]
MPDYILEISFESAVDDFIQSRLYLTDSLGSTSVETSAGTTTVSAYFGSPEARDAARDAFEGMDVELRPVDRDRVNWLERYQQSLQAIEIGERFLVAPDAALLPPESKRLRIIVPQEQAFGTGSHETTALCITLLETMEVRGRRGLDIGSGSGILALAMHRLGSPKVIAFDNDPDAYAALRDNRMRNNVPESAMPIFIGGTEALRGGQFDLLTMNIIPEVIIPLLGSVVVRMGAGASLIVSGVLNERRDDVVEAAGTHGLRLGDERRRGEWWAGVFQRSR